MGRSRLTEKRALCSALALVALAGVLPAGAAAAGQGKVGCYELFIEADTNRNGIIEEGEDTKGYVSLLASKGVATIAPHAITRSEFVSHCEAGLFSTIAGGGGGAAGGSGAQTGGTNADRSSPNASTPNDPGLPKDLGKGDITPGVQQIPEEDARRRLRANGFAEVSDLHLDAQGVWRGSAIVNGKRVDVAVDPQGDILGGK